MTSYCINPLVSMNAQHPYIWEKNHSSLEAFLYGIFTIFILLILWWFYESGKLFGRAKIYDIHTARGKRWRIIKALMILGIFCIVTTFFGEKVGSNLICEHNHLAACLIEFLVIGGVITVGMLEGMKESEARLQLEKLEKRISELETMQSEQLE